MKYTFAIAVIGIISLTILGVHCNMDVASEVAGIASAFILGSSGAAASHVWATSKDSEADTVAAIDKVTK